MQSIPGVIDAQSGYANGTGKADAKYQTILGGKTGFRETVRVEYDPAKVSLDHLLLAYFTLLTQQSSTNRVMIPEHSIRLASTIPIHKCRLS